ncbi:type I-C CRISPR-associated protein Cas5 [Mariprofundus erugo]|uniref:type I-C CRISPR-associated protein Cas5c n=1 Tax=Mariprofundus erugo TaxID=2528639 RepID=UPI0010FEE7EC|nr:type I-C CRISPR-associated protein Cas5c [Mariprofundus erugo]TLS74784.1 type I-C CRISPR-associated protein Cas5 [Mariprofundus erugo]
MTQGVHTLEVWGDLACFTRPEMKVERFSYPVITPSAARGIFDAIYWDGIRERKGNKSSIRPYFYWQVVRITVLEYPRFIALRRNEVKDRVPGASVLNKWMAGTEEPQPIWADGGKDELGTDQKGRTQRQTMALKNVRYRITARIVPKAGFSSDVKKFNAQFERRAKQGKCFQQPYFGCREFPAFFEYVEEGEGCEPIKFDQPLGLMLYDVFDLEKGVVGESDKPFISLFDAHVENGVLEVPVFNSNAVKKPGRV